MPPGIKVSAKQWAKFELLRSQGWGQEQAASAVGVSRRTAYRHESADQPLRIDGRSRRVPRSIPKGALAYADLNPYAKRAWGDFAFFQKRYFGRIATPWQEDAAQHVVEWLASPDKEYAVVNAPPGAGKSTLFTHDIPAWVTVRNRAIRGQIGSKTESSARRYVQRLRRSFERVVPVQGEAESVSRGLALNAEATLSEDFGVFRPEMKDLWAADVFVVLQQGDVLIDEKEPTWSAYGMDSAFLGMRYDLVIWDDVVDKLVLRTEDSRRNQQEWWDDIAEKRLDPGGVMLLQGQRMGGDDLYRYALDKRDVSEDDLDALTENPDAEITAAPKYHHVVYKAHYDDRCHQIHKPSEAPYFPEGCLLDPRRLTWRELRQEMANRRNNYAVIYQQEDVDPEVVLVNKLWVTGGVDPKTKETYPGCYDLDRGLCELPHGLYGQLLSVATADPSPTKYWSVQWWIVRCVDGQPQERYLMDHVRQAMDAPSFLDWSNPTQSYVGLMEEWQNRSRDLHLPITTWVVEANAAQRFMLQYEHVRRWIAAHHVQLIPHQTNRNKNDPEFGIQPMGSLYKYGQVRLPRKGLAYRAVNPLVEEVTHWPGWRTEDCVMAEWFLEVQLPNIIPPDKPLPRFKRPSWLRSEDTYARRSALIAR